MVEIVSRSRVGVVISLGVVALGAACASRGFNKADGGAETAARLAATRKVSLEEGKFAKVWMKVYQSGPTAGFFADLNKGDHEKPNANQTNQSAFVFDKVACPKGWFFGFGNLCVRESNGKVTADRFNLDRIENQPLYVGKPPTDGFRTPQATLRAMLGRPLNVYFFPTYARGRIVGSATKYATTLEEVARERNTKARSPNALALGPFPPELQRECRQWAEAHIKEGDFDSGTKSALRGLRDMCGMSMVHYAAVGSAAVTVSQRRPGRQGQDNIESMCSIGTSPVDGICLGPCTEEDVGLPGSYQRTCAYGPFPQIVQTSCENIATKHRKVLEIILSSNEKEFRKSEEVLPKLVFDEAVEAFEVDLAHEYAVSGFFDDPRRAREASRKIGTRLKTLRLQGESLPADIQAGLLASVEAQCRRTRWTLPLTSLSLRVSSTYLERLRADQVAAAAAQSVAAQQPPAQQPPAQQPPGPEPVGSTPASMMTYFNQNNNANSPGSTCGITSTAMALSGFGHKVTPDQLFSKFGKSKGQSPEGVSSIFKDYGVNASPTRVGSRAKLKEHLAKGYPAVVHGDWTSAGHIVAIKGFTDKGWIINDPAGDYNRCYLCERGSAGKDNLQTYGSKFDQLMSHDGDVWYTLVSAP